MTYLELTKPRKYQYGGIQAQSVPKIEIVEEEFVPESLKASWEAFKNLIILNSQVSNFNTDELLEEESHLVNTNIETSNYNSPIAPAPKSFVELLKEEGIDARITSSYRAGATTSNGSVSHHSNKENPAVDIVPTNGKSYDELIIQMITNPRIIKYFKDNGWGIHSEVSKDQLNSLTTGAHLHIGPDKVAKKGLAKILEKYNSGIKTDLWKYNLS